MSKEDYIEYCIFMKNVEKMKSNISIPKRVTIRYLQLILPILLMLFIFLCILCFGMNMAHKDAYFLNLSNHTT